MPKAAADLLAEVVRLAYRPALTFHPGTQCTDPGTWASYIHRARDIAWAAGWRATAERPAGGFPGPPHGKARCRRQGQTIFRGHRRRRRAPPLRRHMPPALVAEPGPCHGGRGGSALHCREGDEGPWGRGAPCLPQRLASTARWPNSSDHGHDATGLPRQSPPMAARAGGADPRLLWGRPATSLDRIRVRWPGPPTSRMAIYIVHRRAWAPIPRRTVKPG